MTNNTNIPVASPQPEACLSGQNGAAGSAQEVNRVVGVTVWSEICRLSRLMSGGLGFYAPGLSSSDEDFEIGGRCEKVLILCYPRLDLVYVATDSIGGREWKTEGEPKDTQPSFNGEYLGWGEEQSSSFCFTSATSDASILATKLEGGLWRVEFWGTDQPDRESGYAKTLSRLSWMSFEAQLPRKRLFTEAVCMAYGICG